MSVSPAQIQPRPARSTLPPLQAGDHLDQPSFHERYEAMPRSFRAELIGGIVYVPSPLKVDHASRHIEATVWLGTYKAHTPGTLALDNATHILGDDCEVQPDASLLIINGQTRKNEGGYIEGAPELVVEVASSSEAYDLHSKKRDYERYGVQEYLALVLRDERPLWFVREGDRFAEMPPGADNIFRSRVFPGLWLDAAALFRGDTTRFVEVLNAGLASPEHVAFVSRLQAVSPPHR